MKKNIFLIAFLLIASTVMAQTAKEICDNGIDLKNDGKYEEALTLFKKAISVDATYNEAYYQAGWCSNELEKYDDALGFLNKYNPDNDDDRAYKSAEMGYSNYKLNNRDAAIEAYKKALEYRPNYGTAYRGLGNVYYDNSEDADALKYFELAMQYDEENSKAYYYTLGWLYNDIEEYENAEKILLKAVDYDPQSQKSFEELAYTYLKLEQFNDGVTAAKKAIEINKEASLGYHYLGNCYMGLGQKDKAMEAYNKLKAFDEDEAKLLLDEINDAE